MPRSILFFAFISVMFLSCIEQPNSYTKLPPGEWRGILKLTDPDQVSLGTINDGQEKILDYFELPFNMDVVYTDNGMEVFLINGEERIPIEAVHYGRDPATAKDTLKMEMTAFDTSMDGFYEDNYIEGYWVVNYKENYTIPFLAQYGLNHRFINKTVPDTKDFGGKWKVVFEYDNEDAYPAIAELEQNGNKLDGTFRTETGDYRFLSGNASGDKMRLSVFDGAHAFLFSGSMDSDTIYGEFRSGKHYKSKWYAVKDNNYKLTNPYQMTKATMDEPIAFSFPDTKGNMVSLSKANEGGKVKLINIMGSWCPNCKDEIKYLKEIKKQYGENLELYTIAYERYRDASKANALLDKYKATMGMDWPLLLGGYADKKQTTESLPFIDKIYSYPTLFVVDQKNNIRHIHTGFNGPATSEYQEYKVEMAKKLETILSE